MTIAKLTKDILTRLEIMKKLYVKIENPDGFSWDQEIEYNPQLGESVRYAVNRCEAMLGRGYIVVSWWLGSYDYDILPEEGRRGL